MNILGRITDRHSWLQRNRGDQTNRDDKTDKTRPFELETSETTHLLRVPSCSWRVRPVRLQYDKFPPCFCVKNQDWDTEYNLKIK